MYRLVVPPVVGLLSSPVLSRVIGDETIVVGSLRYMAPERFSGEADSRSDLYSLGVTLYELLTLEYAYEKADRPALIHQITQGDLTPPRKKNPNLPRDLDTVVQKTTATEPAERYRSAGQLARDLQCCLDDRPIASRRVGYVLFVLTSIAWLP